MKLMNIELLKSNCAGDEGMMRELISMGLQSLENSMASINTAINDKDWDNLARILHKLRPILCYCGVTSLTDELLLIEQNAKERKDLNALEEQMGNMSPALEQVQSEMQQQMSLLSK